MFHMKHIASKMETKGNRLQAIKKIEARLGK